MKNSITDCHVNIWNTEHYLPEYYHQMSRVRPGKMHIKTDADSLYEALNEVDRAILFSPRYGDSAGVQGDDQVTAEAIKRYPDKFIGFAYVDPREPDCLKRLRHSVEELGLVGVKYGPIYNGIPLSDPRLDPIYHYCQMNDLPLTLHMGTTFARNAPADLGRAIHTEPVAMRFPELKIILAHMGHPWFEDCIAVVRKQPNIFCEVSAIFYRPWQYYNILINCQEYMITDKIFFGTDYPFSGVKESIEALNKINSMVEGTALPRVTPKTIDQILHSNPSEKWWKDPH